MCAPVVAPDVNPAQEATLRVHVDVLINRCLADIADLDALRQSVDALGQLAGQRAEFAFCFFSLELARMGESRAREAFAQHAGVLLQAHRDPLLAQKLLGGNPELATRWYQIESLLKEFDLQNPSTEPPLPEIPPGGGAFAPTSAESVPVLAVDNAEPLIEAAYAARSDVGELAVAIDRLRHIADERRREFCLCLFNLELARLGQEDAKREFAGRATLLWEAYADPQVAATLVGASSVLSLLWTDLVPYLDEFFDTTSGEDEEGEFVLEPGPEDEVPPEAIARPTTDEMAVEVLEEADVVESAPVAAETVVDDVEILEDTDAPRPATAKRPPPPPSVTPQPGKIPAFRSHTPVRMPMLRKGPPPPPKARALPPPPPRSASVGLAPDTARFWTFAEKALDLLPDQEGQLSGRQAFAIATKKERHQLQRFAVALTTEFPASAEARALASLVHLHLGCHLKEKTLFGKPNDQRRDLLRTGLSLMTGDALAAAQAAVLFENDGVHTMGDFAQVVDLVHGYLGFCIRNALDPVGDASIDRYLNA